MRAPPPRARAAPSRSVAATQERRHRSGATALGGACGDEHFWAAGDGDTQLGGTTRWPGSGGAGCGQPRRGGGAGAVALWIWRRPPLRCVKCVNLKFNKKRFLVRPEARDSGRGKRPCGVAAVIYAGCREAPSAGRNPGALHPGKIYLNSRVWSCHDRGHDSYSFLATARCTQGMPAMSQQNYFQCLAPTGLAVRQPALRQRDPGAVGMLLALSTLQTALVSTWPDAHQPRRC